MMATEIIKVISEYTTLDLLLWRRFKRDVPGLVEKTLAANPGLARLGPFLPVGTSLTVEAPPPITAPAKSVPVIQLYE